MGPHMLTTWQPWALGACFPGTEVVLPPHSLSGVPQLQAWQGLRSGEQKKPWTMKDRFPARRTLPHRPMDDVRFTGQQPQC